MQQECKYYSIRRDLSRQAHWKQISTIASSWLRALSLAPARSLAETSSKPETRSRWSVNLFPKCSTCLIPPLWTNSTSWKPKPGEVYATHWWKILLETELLNYRLKFNIQWLPAETFFYNAHLKVSVSSKKVFLGMYLDLWCPTVAFSLFMLLVVAKYS